MKKVRVFPKALPRDRKVDANPSSMFVFCEKSSGVAQFRAESKSNLNCTVDWMAGLLAMQCLVRGSDPGDFAILVPAEKAFASRLMSRAAQLLEEGRAAASPVSLSPRQKEILRSVVCNRANKEIASQLNITVRTVKFHISSLLTKFGVSNRAELARRAAAFMRPAIVESATPDLDQRSDEPVRQEFERVGLRTTLHVASKARNTRFHERTLTA